MDSFASQYGWTIPQILNLTLEEVNLLAKSASERIKATYGTGSKTSSKAEEPKEKRKLEDALDKMERLGKVG